MKLKLVYERANGECADIVVTADANATVGEIADGIALVDPARRTEVMAGLTLGVANAQGGSFVTLDADRPIGEVPMASGYAVQVLMPASAPRALRNQNVSVVVRVIAGPAQGQEFRLSDGSYTIGRDPGADILIEDTMVSKKHARLDVRSTLELVDLNSANGLLVDGGLVPRLTIQPGQPVTLGESVLSFMRTEIAQTVEVEGEVHGGAVPFNRSPKVESRYPGREYPRPAVPAEIDRQPFPWLLMIAPVMLGFSMFLFTGRVISLLFIAMTPMMMIGNYVMTRSRQNRQHESAVAKFEAQLESLESALVQEVPREQAVRRAEAPSVKEMLEAGLARSSSLFSRRPEHWTFLNLRLGVATAPSRNTVAEASDFDDGLPDFTARLEDLIARHRLVPDVPLTEDPMLAGALGVVGDGATAAGAARGLLVQAAALHSPAEMVITALTGPKSVDQFDWLKWLPHVSSLNSPLSSSPLADSAATAAKLVSELEDLVAARTGQTRVSAADLRGARPGDLEATGAGATVGAEEIAALPTLPVVLVLITGDAPADRSRLVQLAERGAAAGIVPVWIEESFEDLPGACRTYVDVSRGLVDATVGYVRHGLTFDHVVVEAVSKDEALQFGRRMSALVDAGAVVDDASDLPRTVTLLSLLGPEMAETSHAVVDRWIQNESIIDRRSGSPRPLLRPRTLRALVGQAGVDAMHLDLRSQGPHALVAGTTGAGKSEFLQSWVLAMAAEHSPDRLTFLFVDYKGGSAFAETDKLPHCVGLVTDLTPHLVKRALTSLRAELHHREELINAKGVKDLMALEERGDSDCPPALVLVIDEFAALASDVPDFVDGVVDIAQRGRSLGIHLIMATQRPAGVIRDNIRANTNLRIALRVSDESHSSDVVGSPVAASFDPAVPGRGIAKTGPGRLVPFQSAYARGWTRAEPEAHEIAVHQLRFGAQVAWEDPRVPEPGPTDRGPTDQERLVASVQAAAAMSGLAVPRRPWLNELKRSVDLVRIASLNDRELVIGLGDLPDRQRQDPIHFHPDVDGNLAVYGTGGSGKSVLLRTLAASAGITPRGGPVHVYALDFASGGLQMLQALPHVGSVILGDDPERVIRLLRTLRGLLDGRSRSYPAIKAGSIPEYRVMAGEPDEPRILLLLDGLPAFRDQFDGVVGRTQWYGVFLRLLSEGPKHGIHVVFTADRPGAVPSSVTSSVPRRVVLRLAEEVMYMVLDVDPDVLTSAKVPGRGVVDGIETQVAILGGSGNVADQSAAISQLAEALQGDVSRAAPPIRSLPTEVLASDLPSTVDGLPLLGVSDEDLAPVGFAPQGIFLVGGGPASGRTNALQHLSGAVRRAIPTDQQYYLGNRSSALALQDGWVEKATTPDEVAALATRLTEVLEDPSHPHTSIFIESLSDFYSSTADKAIVALTKAVKRTEDLLVVESETSTLTATGPLFAEVKSARRGILLQPETIEGDTILRTSFPRIGRAEFPVGRGMFVQRGKVLRVQLPLA